MAWRLIAKEILRFQQDEDCSSNIPSFENLVIRAVDAILPSDSDESADAGTLGATEFFIVAAKPSEVCDRAVEKILCAVSRLMAPSAPHAIAASRIALLAACAKLRPAEVARALTLSESWPAVFRCSDYSSAAVDLSAACLANDRRLLNFLGAAGLFDTVPRIGSSAAIVAGCIASGGNAGARKWFEGLFPGLQSALESADTESVKNALSILAGIGGVSGGLSAAAAPTARRIFDCLVPLLSVESAAVAMTALTRATPHELADVALPLTAGLNALAKASLSAPTSSALHTAQIRLIGAWSSKIQSAGEAFSSWFSSMWRKHEAHDQTLLELLDALNEVSHLNGLSPALAHVLATCTKRTCTAAVLTKALSSASLQRGLLINRAATGRVVSALLTAHAKFNAKSMPKEASAVIKLNAVLGFVTSLVGCKQTAESFLPYAEDLIDVLSSKPSNKDVLLLCLLNVCACEDPRGRRLIANSQVLMTFLQKHDSDRSAGLCLELVNTIRRVKTCE